MSRADRFDQAVLARTQRLVGGQLALARFSAWFRPRYGRYQLAPGAFAHDVMLRLAEHDQGDWSELDLRRLLDEALRHHALACVHVPWVRVGGELVRASSSVRVLTGSARSGAVALGSHVVTSG